MHVTVKEFIIISQPLTFLSIHCSQGVNEFLKGPSVFGADWWFDKVESFNGEIPVLYNNMYTAANIILSSMDSLLLELEL